MINIIDNAILINTDGNMDISPLIINTSDNIFVLKHKLKENADFINTNRQ